MPTYQNSGLISRNKDKTSDKPKWPDYNGKALIGTPGVEYWISGWIKIGKDGEKFLSLAFKPKDAPAQAPTATTTAPPPQEDLDGLPF